ncbi:MAG: fused protease/ribonucleoside-triphosphate reductase [Myxococcota bacterium]
MFLDVERHGPFVLDPTFLERYRQRPVEWGFGALSWVTYRRTYSRDGEQWWQTCRRVIEGMFTIQRVHCLQHGLRWDAHKARAFAEDAYDRLWSFKWTPPGRGLWIMGTRFVYERGAAALNNCGFVSTRNIVDAYAEPFVWMLAMSMLGVGVGFDVRGKGTVTVVAPVRGPEPHTIGDSREGWCEATARLLNAYVGKGTLPARWDYSQIRPAGTPLRGFGGVASGPEPLRKMLESLEQLHDGYRQRPVDAALIVDTMNVIGRCVAAGGSRRSAQLALGGADDPQFLDLKQDREKLTAWRWVSNNSVVVRAGTDYRDMARRTVDNGEPGFFWLENAQAYGRMKDPPNWLDANAEGSNPCVEQTLWDRELCTLVETYPARHESVEDYKRTLTVAYQYAKVVTLVPTPDARTNVVMARNRRIGCSMTGIVQAINRHGYRAFLGWCEEGYRHIQELDRAYSDWLCVPRSIKTTTVKPSGTVSLLAGATPGVHWDHAPYYVRRVRIAQAHPLVEMCARAGYPVEPDRYAPQTMVISFPVHSANLDRRKADVPLWEKVDLAAQMQRYWSDNQVSCTAEFDPEREGGELQRVLSAYEDRLKAMVFLPARGHGYEQPPYEEMTREQYVEQVSRLRPLEGVLDHEHELEARGCEGGVCSFE